LGKARENNKVNCAKSMAESLIIKFKEIRQLQNNESVINRATVEFHSLKELAKRFALSFGLDALKNREAVTSLHREGILLAVNPLENPDDPNAPPPNLSFLEILTEFSNKLLKQDKKVVLNYLDKRIEGATPSRLVRRIGFLIAISRFFYLYLNFAVRGHTFIKLARF
jgi:cohesin complex subunit SA-1/2